jgi:glycosyltransferase involved in cell wall biosynthesis
MPPHMSQCTRTDGALLCPDRAGEDLLLESPRKRHHVLYLIDRMVSTGGGAEGALARLCKSLPGERYRCSVVTFFAGPEVSRQLPCPLYVLPLRHTCSWNGLQMAIKLARLIRSEHVDIVHTFFPASDLWGGLVAKLSGCPILVSSRRDMGVLRSRKHDIAYRLAGPMFDQVHAVSAKVGQWSIASDGLSPSNVVTVHNGVDLEAIDLARPLLDIRHELGIGGASHIIGAVANLRHVKGIDVLLQAAASVHELFPRAVFVVVGLLQVEAYVAQLLELRGRLGLDSHVKFVGMREDVYSVLKACDVFCLPSRSEGMSNALLEAMACGMPCVATDVGGNPEVVEHGSSGFLVPSEQPKMLAARIAELLSSPEKRLTMGLAGRRIVERKFTAQHMVDRCAALYEGLLQRRGIA